MRSPRPWCFSHPTTAATSRERNCLWMAASHKCRPFIAVARATNRLRFELSEPVPDAADGLDAWRLELRREELAAKPRHVDVHGPGLDEAVAAPDEVKQVLAPEDPPRGADQRGEELELLGRQLDKPVLHPDLAAVALDLEIAGPQTGLLLLRVGRLAPAHDCPDPCDELPRRERLRHVVVGAELESENLVPFLDPARDHDHGDSGEIRVLLEAPADLPAVQLGHHDVEQDHVRTDLARQPQSVGAVRRQDDIVALLGEVVADELGDVVLVLHQQHSSWTLRAIGGVRTPAAARPDRRDLRPGP